MNHYPHHIGDFNNATRHLTRLERSVYRDLLDLYYDTEKPLWLDLDRLARRIVANQDDERAAMVAVLAEFFEQTPDGYRNARADREIEAYQRMADGGRRGAEKRWGKATECPPHSPPIAPPSIPQWQPEPEPEPKEKTLSGKPDVPARQVESKRLRAEALPILDLLNQRANRAYQAVPANVDLIVARLREGATPTQLRQVVVKKCREWAGDERMADYLRPATLFNRTKFAQYVGELVPDGGGNELPGMQ